MYEQIILRGVEFLRSKDNKDAKKCYLKRSNAMYRPQRNSRNSGRKSVKYKRRRSISKGRKKGVDDEVLLVQIGDQDSTEKDKENAKSARTSDGREIKEDLLNINSGENVTRSGVKVERSFTYRKLRTVTNSEDTNNLINNSHHSPQLKSSMIPWILRWKYRRIHPIVNPKIQEVDDSFFERFGSLLREQTESAAAQEEEEHHRVADQAAALTADTIPEENGNETVSITTRKISSGEKSTTSGGDTDGSDTEAESTISGPDSDIEEKNKEDYIAVVWNIDELYSEILYEIIHNVGCDVAVELGQTALFSYAQDAFKITNDRHRTLLDAAEQLQPPDILLNVEVIEAKELRAKDSNGLSDPFVTLFLAGASSHRYNTSVKSGTLNPIWEEHFALPVSENTSDDTLCLEVWDFDPAESVREKFGKLFEVKGVKGVRKLFKEIAVTAATGQHNNELIGRARIPLKAIPASGMTMWYSLDKKNKIARQGVVKVRLTFSSEKNCQVAGQEHRHLLKVLLLHELEMSKVAQYWWSGSFSVQGEALLTQHIAQSGLSPTDVALAQWAVYCAIHVQHALNFGLFATLLDRIVKPLQSSVSICGEDVKIFWDAAKKLLPSCYSVVRKLRRKCNITGSTEKHAMKQLVSVLTLLSRLSTLDQPDGLDLFPVKSYQWLTSNNTNTSHTIHSMLEAAVTQGAVDWFNHLAQSSEVQAGDESEVGRLQYLIKLVQLVRTDLQKAVEFYDKKFQEIAHFKYAKTLYIFYQVQIATMAEPEIMTICQSTKKLSFVRDKVTESESADALNVGTTLFELYLVLQRFVVLGSGLCPTDYETFHIRNFHSWFHRGVAQWLDIAVFKALQRIKKAVELDNLIPVSSSVKYSSSAVDTLTIFYQIKVFWEQLNWPDVESCYTFIAKIIDDICRCSVFFADQMSARVDGMGDVRDNYEQKFQVTQEWCLAINNIDYVRQSLVPFTDDLGMEEIIQKLSDLRSPLEAERCRQTLETVIANAIDTVRNKIIELLEIVAEKMCPSMKRLLVEGAELFQQDSNSIDRLMMYVDDNLATLHQELNEDNFNRTLEILWDNLSKILEDLIQSNLEKRRPPSFFANLHQTLKIMVKAFKQSEEPSECSELRRTEDLLRINGLETPELIHQVHLDLCNEQKSTTSDSNFGQITVRIKFHNNELHTEIINARNLPAMDSNGSCDSFVRVHLLPEDKFTNISKPKTQTHSKNQFPLFDEKFELPLSNTQRNLKDGIVLFSVKDYDLLGYNNQYIGEAFVSFNDIPESTDSIQKLTQVHLQLIRPSNLTTDAIKALEYRQGDKQAKEFLKKLKQKMGGAAT